jgi:hypothetical protein
MRFTAKPDGALPRDAVTGGSWLRVEDPDLPRPVYVRIAVADDGRRVCTGLILNSTPERELTARELRKIPLAAILEKLMLPQSPQLRGILEQQKASRSRAGRQGYPDDHYRRVADAYRRAKRAEPPSSPIKALETEFHVSEPTVHRWLRAATERGFLTKEER